MTRNFFWVSPQTVGLWPFGDDLLDIGPNGLDASGSLSSDIGRFGKCTIFPGTGGASIATGSIPAAMQIRTFTIKLFYKGTDTTSPAALFGAGGVYVGSYYQYAGYYIWTVNGTPRLTIGNSGTSLNIYMGSSKINDDEWHHLIATRNTDFIRIYIDGVLDAEHESPSYPSFGSSAYYRFSGMGGAYVPGYTPLSVGYRPTCRLSNIELLNVALTERDVRKLWQFYRGYI